MTPKQEDLAGRVRRAFDAVRQGDLAPVSELEASGATVLPMLASYVNDPSEDVRREAISLAAVVDGMAALPVLSAGLADSAADVRERAALALYEKYKPADLASDAALGRRLAGSVAKENPAAAAILLLGYFPGPESKQALVAERDRKPAFMVKLFPWSAPIPSSLAALVALVRLGDGQALIDLSQKVKNADPAKVEFLLAALRDIESAPLLGEVSRILDDTRKAVTVLHSGPDSERRLCDVAVNAFVERFQLPITFELSPMIPYTSAQIEEVRRKLGAIAKA